MKQLLEQAILQTPEQQIQYLKEHHITINELLSCIYDKDREVREQLSIQLMMNLLESNEITNEQLIESVEKLISTNYLFYNIAANDLDAVFTRSTSALWLTVIMQNDLEKSFLPGELASSVIEKVSHYLSKEQDVRGFVEHKGWANAATNATNLYITLLKHPHFELRFTPNMLLGISKALRTGYVFSDDEESRFSQFIHALDSLEYPEEIIIEWIEQLFDQLQFNLYERGYSNEFYKHKTNLIHFMQSLYFKLKFTHTYPKVKAVASIFISKWS